MRTALLFAVVTLLDGPAPAAAQRHEAYRPGSVWTEGGDEPGCSFAYVGSDSWWVPGQKRCRQGCCATHDQCFADHGCTAASWVTTIRNKQANLQDWLAIRPDYWIANQTTIPWIRDQFRDAFGEPQGNDLTDDCAMCNQGALNCFHDTLWNGRCENPGNCPEGKESCYDRTCADGADFYCSTDCYDPTTDPCDTAWGDDVCMTAIYMGYSPGTRFGMHGGALLSCVPWCYNLAMMSDRIADSGPICGDGDDGRGNAAEAVGVVSSYGLCCFCADGGFPWNDPEWPIPMGDVSPHSGAEGGHGAVGGCNTDPDNCYIIDTGQGYCWNNGHMCAQHKDGTCDATGMCCG